jgi:hypothetical protein
LKRQLLTADLAQDLGAIEVSRSVTDHLVDMPPSLGTSLALKLLRISAAINCRFKDQSFRLQANPIPYCVKKPPRKASHRPRIKHDS